MRILCIGEMLIDFTPVENMKNTYTANPGGAPANVAVAVARNGVKAGFLGKLGNDDFGKLLINTLENDGVEILLPQLTDEATTTLAFVTLDETGDRSFTFARKPGADLLLDENDVSGIDYSEWDIVHFGSVSQSGSPSKEAVLHSVKKAKEKGKLISFDINYRDKIWSYDDCKKEVEKVIPYVDMLKISEEELGFVGGEDNILPYMKEHNIAVVVLTLGKDGARIYFENEMRQIPSMNVKVVDTTGAGDAYWGGFLSCLLSENVKNTSDITMDKLVRAGKYGAVSGGLCIQKHGGIPALPYKDDIINCLEKA
ncbi:MAG: carbohydrate kinase [Lachnospiraceae bacterium]|nr:carbohydrate kinase [Lachnospiraceae bacterium]